MATFNDGDRKEIERIVREMAQLGQIGAGGVGAGVLSVNGQTGTVALDASSIGAVPGTTYSANRATDAAATATAQSNALSALVLGVVNTITDLQAYVPINGISTVQVKDVNRGGVFNWYSSGYTADNGRVFASSLTGYWVRQTVGQTVQATWYNVITDGADHTAEFQNMVNSLSNLFQIDLPQGQININGRIVWPYSPNIKGKGKDRSIIKNNSTSASDDTFYILGSTGVTKTWGILEDFTVTGSDQNGNGMYFELVGRFLFRNVAFRHNGKHGLSYINSWTPQLEYCQAEDNKLNGLNLVGGANNQLNGAIILSGSFSRNLQDGIYLDNGTPSTNAASLYSLTCSGNTRHGININVGSSLNIIDPCLEFNGGNCMYIWNDNPGYISSVTVMGGYFLNTSTNSANNFFRINNALNVKILNPAVVNAATTDLFVAELSGTTDGFEIEGVKSAQVGVGGSVTSDNLPTVAGSFRFLGKRAYNTSYPYIGVGTFSPNYPITLGSAANGIVAHNTADQTTNYERVRMYWSGNAYRFLTENGGTGVNRSLEVGTANTRLLFNEAVSPFYSFSRGSSAAGFTAMNFSGTWSASSGINNLMSVTPTINQSATGGYRGLFISPFEQATGSGTKNLLDVGTNSAAAGAGTHTTKFAVANTGKITIASGANASIGTVALVGGTATVSNTLVTASSIIMLTSQADGGSVGTVRITAKVAGTSFTITSSSGTDTSTIGWWIVN